MNAEGTTGFVYIEEGTQNSFNHTLGNNCFTSLVTPTLKTSDIRGQQVHGLLIQGVWPHRNVQLFLQAIISVCSKKQEHNGRHMHVVTTNFLHNIISFTHKSKNLARQNNTLT